MQRLFGKHKSLLALFMQLQRDIVALPADDQPARDAIIKHFSSMPLFRRDENAAALLDKVLHSAGVRYSAPGLS